MSVAAINKIQTKVAPAAASPRRVVSRTRGHRSGPIVRLVSPSDLGEMIKPFVFLDHFDVVAENAPRFGFHPHSGIATLSVLLDGGFSYEDSTGAKGEMKKGSVEWMQAGGGVWHTGFAMGERVHGYQLWIALPPDLENGPPMSRYHDFEEFAAAGPARVLLGSYDGARSPIEAPQSINYIHVRLRAGQVWRYQPPAGHDVAWIAVHKGQLATPDAVSAGELAVFEASTDAISFVAQGDTDFMLGSAVHHPHELVLGSYSVHTNAKALAQGEAEINRIAHVLQSAGKL